jgi:hypothetical protein
MVHLAKCILKYHEGELCHRRPPYETPPKKKKKLDRSQVLSSLQLTVRKNLQRTVLFLDEVLPSKESPGATTEPSKVAERLRFLRNFGHALGMRVVMAGTAATAANMIGVANPSGVTPASRSGPADIGWMEIYFLCSPVTPFATAKHLERPWLAALLENCDTSRGMESSVLGTLANDISNEKKFSLENRLLWLAGPWLASTSEFQVSPFKLRAAELVRGHFFEPAIVVRSDSKRPYVGTGLARVQRLKG